MAKEKLTEAEVALIEAHRAEEAKKQRVADYYKQVTKAVQQSAKEAETLCKQMRRFKEVNQKRFQKLRTLKEGIFKTKQYIRVERVDDQGKWTPIPLTMTDC